MVKSCKAHSPPLSQIGQSKGCEVSINSRMDLRPSLAFSVVVRTSIPSTTSVVQDVSSLGAKAILIVPSSFFSKSPVTRFFCG